MTPNLEVVFEFVKSLPEWALVDRIGVTNCRKIAGSQTYSQHSWSNAMDIHFTPSFSIPATGEALAAGTRMRDKIRVQFEEYVNSILWQTTDHWDHIHVDLWPKGHLTPPCAGGLQRIKFENGSVQTAPFPLTIKEEDMPLSDEDVARIAAAVWADVTIPNVDVPGTRTFMADALKRTWAQAKKAADTPTGSGPSVSQIVAGVINAIKAQWAK
jgi:hypothetical protein